MAGNVQTINGVKGNFEFTYDNARDVISRSDGKGNTTQYQYDARHDLTKVIYPDLTTKSFAYDGAGNLISVTDQSGNLVQYNYDVANQLQTVTQVNSPSTSANSTSYGYDGDGNLTSWIDANGHRNSAGYDLLSEPTARVLPDGTSAETATYDPNGNLLSLTHYSGKTTTYTYDAMNRLLSKMPDPSTGEPTASFAYTATGKRSTMSDGSGLTYYYYDNLDRLTSKVTPEGTLTYGYDASGNLVSTTSSNSSGVSVSYNYDDLNRLSTVVDSRVAGSGTRTYKYDAAGNLASANYSNSIQSLLAYDKLNRLSSLATQVSGYIYQRDAVGNRISDLELNGRTVNWSYDGIYRLTNETISSDPAKDNGAVNYSLDPVGNRQSLLSTLPGISSGSSIFDVDDRSSTEASDPNGNTVNAGGKSFVYDSENHLVSVNGGAVTFLYDGDGNRVAKSVNGVVTRYLIDDLNPTGLPQVAEELSGNGVVQRVYTYGLQRISESQVVNSVWASNFYSYDGVGSVRQLTNATGAVTDNYDYDAFGNEVNSTGTTPNNYRYRAEQFDPDAGMYYLRARYYNPATGRFLSQDPWPCEINDPQSLHRYVYTKGNPTDQIDPYGLAAEVEEGEVTELESFGSEGGERAVAREVSCALDTAAAALDVLNQAMSLGGILNLVQLGLNFSECSAEGKYTEENPGVCSLCFAAGTAVHTNHGDVPVEQIAVGDEVASCNRKTGQLEERPVTALTPQHHDKLLEILVEGERTPLRPSTHHPFWVRRGDDAVGRWITSGQLQIGDLLQTIDGNWRRITAITSLHRKIRSTISRSTKIMITSSG